MDGRRLSGTEFAERNLGSLVGIRGGILGCNPSNNLYNPGNCRQNGNRSQAHVGTKKCRVKQNENEGASALLRLQKERVREEP